MIPSSSSSIPIKPLALENPQVKTKSTTVTQQVGIQALTASSSETIPDLTSRITTPGLPGSSIREGESHEMLRRLKPDLKEALLADIEKQPPLTKPELKILKSGSFDDNFFKDEKSIACAFKAYFDGKIDKNRLCSINLHYAAVENSPEGNKVCQLKNSDGTVNEESFKLLMSGSDFFLNPDEKEAIKEAISHLSDEDAQFFTVPLENFPEKSSEITGKPIGELIAYAYHDLKFTFGVSDELPRRQLIIPPQLMNKILETRFPDTAMTLHPVLGFSAPEDFKFLNKRDVWIPCKYEGCPEMELHFKKCSPLGAYMHDAYYHCLVESADPHREFWLELAGQFEGVEGMEKVWDYLLDRNVPSYLNNRGLDDDMNLLLSLSLVIGDLKLADGNYPTDISSETGEVASEKIINYLKDNVPSLMGRYPQIQWPQLLTISMEISDPFVFKCVAESLNGRKQVTIEEVKVISEGIGALIFVFVTICKTLPKDRDQIDSLINLMYRINKKKDLSDTVRAALWMHPWLVTPDNLEKIEKSWNDDLNIANSFILMLSYFPPDTDIEILLELIENLSRGEEKMINLGLKDNPYAEIFSNFLKVYSDPEDVMRVDVMRLARFALDRLG